MMTVRPLKYSLLSLRATARERSNPPIAKESKGLLRPATLRSRLRHTPRNDTVLEYFNGLTVSPSPFIHGGTAVVIWLICCKPLFHRVRTIFQTHTALQECLIAIRVDGAGSVWDPFPGAHHLLEHLLCSKIKKHLIEIGGQFDANTYRESLVSNKN